MITLEIAGDDTPVVWSFSAPVPLVPRERGIGPAPAERARKGTEVDLGPLRAALEALPNMDMGYDEWRDMIFSIHYASEGSDEGLALAEEWSSKSLKHNGDFLRERVWPYVRDERGGKTITDGLIFGAAARQGWQDPRIADDFPDVEPPMDELPHAPRAPTAGEAGTGTSVAERVIPKAQHLTTDQANAVRLQKHFGQRMIVIAGNWHAWCGTHWAKDDGEVYRLALHLSKIIHAEAEAWLRKPTDTVEEKAKNIGIAEALQKWGAKSEGRHAVDNALALTRKLMALPNEKLNTSPWLLNCLNGTVDLRDGKLYPHNPEDYLTKCIAIPYDPVAPLGAWEYVVAQITLEDQQHTKPVASFLKRWFGYCATGSVREQKFVVHWGSGSNGKSTILETVSQTLGEYATVAAPDLLVSNDKSRHPTEMADLLDRRMITAHESEEGAVLREGFIKQVTGGDAMKGRFMRADFFEFTPTHKVQLLTNFKPIIKGQDYGIWRRVLLMPYHVRFGDAAEIAAGKATHLKDKTMIERIIGEKAGVLRWLVEGAVEWYRDGLNPPDAVLAASRDYQSEQDRLLQFCTEECELQPDYSQPLGELYAAYQLWCKASGYNALGKRRYQQELERIVPRYQAKPEKSSASGVRRTVVKIYGLRTLDSAEDD